MKGSLKPAGPGKWRLILYLGIKPGGGKRYKWVTFNGTKRQAESELARLVAQLTAGDLPDPGKVTVLEFLERWLKEMEPRLAPKTVEVHRDIIRKHVGKRIGHHKLGKLSPLHLTSYYNELRREGRLDGKGGLSEGSILLQHRTLSQAFTYAVRWGYLTRNPVDQVDAPRPDREERDTLNDTGATRILDVAAGTSMYLPAVLAMATGLRRGELLGMRWADVDFTTRTLTVRQTRSRVNDGQGKSVVMVQKPKTHRSKRPVTVPPIVADLLRVERRRQLEIAAIADQAADSEWVVCYQNNKPWDPQWFAVSWKQLCLRAEVEPVSVHEIRHSHITWLLEDGISLKEASDRAGHSSIQITADTYAHVKPERRDLVAEVVETRMRRLLGADPVSPIGDSPSNPNLIHRPRHKAPE